MCHKLFQTFLRILTCLLFINNLGKEVVITSILVIRKPRHRSFLMAT